jgi:hypothetical protein
MLARRIVEAAFAAGAGIWAVTDRYVDLVPVGDGFAVVLLRCSVVLMLLCAIVLIGMWTYQSVRTRGLPRGMIVLAGGLVAAELFWRFLAHGLPLNGYKVVAMAVLITQPLVAALGVAAVILTVRDMRSLEGAA